MLQDKKILLGVSGGIAIYKAVDLVSKLRKQGAQVRVVMTEHAAKFVTPLLFAEISGNQVAASMWEREDYQVEHIALARWADLVLLAPATANILAKLAAGIADDMLSTVLLATRAPVLVCPAMNTEMYQHPATQANLKTLTARGVTIMEPEAGPLACGVSGTGRLPEVPEIIAFLQHYLAQKDGDLAGLQVLVTAAGTREPIDPVRYVGNRSSGKMGYAIAQAAAWRGAQVTLVTGPSALTPPPYVQVVNVETTEEMKDACLQAYPRADIVIKAAAVADYKPREVSAQKIKKAGNEALTLVLDKNPDILQLLGQQKQRQFLVGFAAETQNLLANARAKIQKKNLDLLVANDVTLSGAGFGTETNIVKFLYADGRIEELTKMSKADIAQLLLNRILAERKKRLV
mgnify:CR=1 FL=1